MKINVDCMRDVLLYIEENLTVTLSDDEKAVECNSLDVLSVSEALSNYCREDVWYSIKMLAECDYIDVNGIDTQDYFALMSIDAMTYAGHKFIESIRPQTIWEKTKSIISKIGSHTLTFVEDTAQKVAIEAAKALISNQL